MKNVKLGNLLKMHMDDEVTKKLTIRYLLHNIPNIYYDKQY